MSPEIESQKWKGVFGENHYRKKYKATVSDIMNDRHLILVGRKYSDCEVYGSYGTHFIAIDMISWYQEAWDGLKGLV